MCYWPRGRRLFILCITQCHAGLKETSYTVRVFAQIITWLYCTNAKIISREKHLFVPLFLVWVVQDPPSQRDCKAFNSVSAHTGSPGSATDARHQTAIIKKHFLPLLSNAPPEKKVFYVSCVFAG